ncbi:MAG TPA: hypothetical protein VGH28_10415 [Polyangiaceae bacterium]
MNTPQINPHIDIDSIILKASSHNEPDDYEPGKPLPEGAEMCVMEAIAVLANEAWNDHPKCVCESFGFLRRVNDRVSDDALRTRMLKPIMLTIIGTKSTKAVERVRRFMLLDWAIREDVPRIARAAGLNEEASRLEALGVIRDDASLQAATKELASMRASAWSRWDARRAEWLATWRAAMKKTPPDAIADALADALADASADASADAIADAIAAASAAASADASADALADAIADASADASADAIWKKAYEAAEKAQKEDGSAYWAAYHAVRGDLCTIVRKHAAEKLEPLTEANIASLHGIVRKMAAVTEADAS